MHDDYFYMSKSNSKKLSISLLLVRNRDCCKIGTKILYLIA